MRLLLLLLCASVLSAASSEVPALPPAVGELPVLHASRVKPLSIAAEELIYAMTGYGAFGEVEVVEERGATRMEKVKGRTYAATTLLVAMMLRPEEWKAKPLLYVPYLPLQQALGLKGQWATLAQAMDSPLVQQAYARKGDSEDTGKKYAPPKTEAEAYTLAERALEAQIIIEGNGIALMPLAPDAAARKVALEQLAPALGDPAQDEALWRRRLRLVLKQAPEKRDAALQAADIWLTVRDLLREDPLLAAVEDPALRQAIASSRAFLAALRSPPTPEELAALQRTLTTDLRRQAERRGADAPYPSTTKLAAELAYQRSHPFTWTWLCYILGGALSAIGLSRRTGNGERGTAIFRIGVALTLIGIAFNLYGLGTRVYITSLGAVTNLFETLVYVALLCSALGLVFARATGQGVYAVAGGIAGGLCAMVGEAIPPDLGSHIDQLQPVLRSKFWLWTHVKTVVASYAAFLLAWGLGNIVLIRAAIRRRAVAAEESAAIYRCLQVGVVLIAAGTLLGAWWADQAWGRFWGWDPKEVWALVILLTYLIPLHLRYVGMVGPTGLAAWAVYGFMSVVMSWYGVNFLLGTGLHAYAFGTGGQGYVLSLCGVQLVVTTVALISVLRRSPPGQILREIPPAAPGPATTDKPASSF